ncbi:MAG: RraA family protein [Acidimicrobiales bacterium]
MRARVKPAWPGARLAAPAAPVRCTPGDNLAIHVAVATAARGHVLVVDVGDVAERGYWGEVLTSGAESRGLAGLVIDGGVRDIDAIATQFQRTRRAHHARVEVERRARWLSVQGNSDDPIIGRHASLHAEAVATWLLDVELDLHETRWPGPAEKLLAMAPHAAAPRLHGLCAQLAPMAGTDRQRIGLEAFLGHF